MSTYRIDGIKYNPANWAGLAPSERAACNRFAAARERELNTITATPHECHGGPFEGSVIELESTTDRSAPMTVGGWVGHYEVKGAPGVKGSCRLEWVGNDAGAPVNTHGTTTNSTAAPEITGKGFDQLRDLLAEMAEDPAEREEITTSSAWTDCKPGHVDDFGDEYTPRPRGAWAVYPVAPVGRSKKKAFEVASDHENGRNTPDNFGALVGIIERPAYRAEWLRVVRRARYTIGRTTYTVTATAAAVDKLRARLIKIKKWLSDKMLTAAGPGRTTEAIPDIAAAMSATLAIAQAQASAATAHQADNAEACGELVTCDGPDNTDTAEATPCADTPADLAQAIAEDHTPAADEPDHYTDPLKTQEQAPDYTEALKTQEQANTLEQAPAVVGFARAKPFSLDPRELLSAGLKVDQLVGLGVLYLGNAANASGEGAITEVNDTRGQSFGGLNMVCTLEDGRVIDAEPWSFTGDLRPIFQFNGKMHGAPYLAQLAAVRASLKAQHSSAQAMAEAEHARQLETLAAEFPQLERQGKNSAGKLAAINIRKLLKQAFKAVKFSVTSDYNSARVSWEDGPTTEQVDAVIGRFDIGHSDCQTDYFYTKETAWSELFGGVQYLTTSRTLSAATIGPVLLSLYGENGPTFEQWRAGKRWDEVAHGNGPWSNAYDSNPCQDPWSWLSHVRRVANGKTQ